MNYSLNKLCCIGFLFSLAILPFATSVAQHHSLRSQRDGMEVMILWNGNASAQDSIDQESSAAMIASMGFAASRLGVRDLESAQLNEHTLLLVPQASSRSLSSREVQRTVSAIEKGLRLVTGGEGPLLSALHIKLGEPQKVGVVIDHNLPGNHLHWADRPKVKWIAELPDTSTQVLYADSATGHSLVVTGKLGRGRYIVLASYLDEISGRGYSRLPTMVNAIVHNLGCRPPFRRQGIDAFFDPAYRIKISTENLVRLWRHWGIRGVHAAAWYYNRTPPYDYKRLIDAAHKNGILVYAWLEWPHVGQGFWSQHPEWRQKNALLQDGKLDWLYLMDLQNPDCMNAALNDLSKQMELDWDGIDIAEFTITGAGGEALAGPSRPDYFMSFGTPMRTEFAKVGGFDPLQLENPNSEHFWMRDSAGLQTFYKFRQTVNNRLLRQVVEFVVNLKKTGKRDWELIHTVVDNSLHPEFNHLLGFDLQATLALVKEFGITLNVEDPYMEWIEPPIRYRRLREYLVSLIPERSSMIDINVVPIHPMDQHGFPSEQATGTELLQQVQTAAEHNGRVCMYSESTLFEQDWPLIPVAMAGGSSITRTEGGWEVTSPATVTLNLRVRDNFVFIDGKSWPAHGTHRVVLPGGNHQLAIRPASAGQVAAKRALCLIALSGELLECQEKEDGIEILYSSPSRCLLTFNQPTPMVLVDGIPSDLPVLKGVVGYLVFAPSGKHRLSMTK